MKTADATIAREIILSLLKAAKIQSIHEIYNRVRPGPDGRIRTTLSPVGTITGRLASKGTFLEASTNLQNLPKKIAKLDPLFDVRRVLVPDPGYLFMEADLSQAEARVVAVLANDQKALDLFASGADIHRITAAEVFGVAPEDITDKQREIGGKKARHSLSYGLGWKHFLEDVNKDSDLTGISISAAEAKAIHSGYHRANPAIRLWHRSVEQEIYEKGFLTTPFGRRLVLIDQNDMLSAIAFVPQSTVADHLNMRLRVIYDKLDPDPFMLLHQIHDAVLGQVKVAQARLVARRLRRLMQHPIQIGSTSLLIPADVSTSSSSWGEMEEVSV